MSRDAIRFKTRTMFAALRNYEVRQVGANKTTRNVSLSLLHRWGLAAPLTGYDWLFTR